MLSGEEDEFNFRVAIALRLDPATGGWVGVQMRAAWQAGVWVVPLTLEVVSATGANPVVLGSVTPPATPDLLDVWRTQPNAELVAELRGDVLTATLDGVITVSAQVPADGQARMALLVEASLLTGAVLTAVPTVVAVQVQSLRDLERLGPPPAILGAAHLEAPSFPTLGLPLRGLIDSDLVKQLNGRQFQFTQDTEVIVGHLTFTFDQGEVVRAHERFGSQEFVACTRDLHFERSKKKGQAWR
jgi:hypothetical protein